MKPGTTVFYAVSSSKDGSTGIWKFQSAFIPEYCYMSFIQSDGVVLDVTIIKCKDVPRILEEARAKGFDLQEIDPF